MRSRHWYWPVGVLVFAIIAEGFSFRTAIKESNATRGALSWKDFIRRAKAPELPVVLLEDFGALIGLVLALGRRRPRPGHRQRHLGRHRHALHRHPPHRDRGGPGGGDQVPAPRRGRGHRRRREDQRPRLSTATRSPASSTCVRSTSARRNCWSPPRSRSQHDDTAAEVAHAINAAEARIREAVPIARVIYLEPDIYSESAAAAGTNPAKHPDGPAPGPAH